MEVFFLVSPISSKSLDFSGFAQSLSVSLCPTAPRQRPDFLSMSSGNAGWCFCVNLREECACSKEDFGSVRSRLCVKDLLLYNKGGPLICRHSSHWCQRKPHTEFKCAMRPFASNSSQGLPYFNIQLWAEWEWDVFLKMLAVDPCWWEVRKFLPFHGQVENLPEQTASSTVHKAATDQGIALHNWVSNTRLACFGIISFASEEACWFSSAKDLVLKCT